ncbi:MAG: hypothetical protein ACTS80_00755 [Candidatus Hodgkinia cicadicola]
MIVMEAEDASNGRSETLFVESEMITAASSAGWSKWLEAWAQARALNEMKVELTVVKS